MKLRSILLGMSAILSANGGFNPLSMVSDFDIRGFGGGSPVQHRSRGTRAHKRWKRARASGRS